MRDPAIIGKRPTSGKFAQGRLFALLALLRLYMSDIAVGQWFMVSSISIGKWKAGANILYSKHVIRFSYACKWECFVVESALGYNIH